MNQGAQPDLDAMGTSKFLLSNQTVDPSIIVANVSGKVSTKIIFLCPVDLKVSERLRVPVADGRDAVLALECSSHIPGVSSVCGR